MFLLSYSSYVYYLLLAHLASDTPMLAPNNQMSLRTAPFNNTRLSEIHFSFQIWLFARRVFYIFCLIETNIQC